MSSLLWRHIVINTRSTWLHGDDRGFRSRDHRIHSSGDYRNPPPAHEHVGLHEYMKDMASPEVHIPEDLRPIIGRTMLAWCREHGINASSLAVAKVHAHGLVELANDIVQVRRIVGDLKRNSSRAVRAQLPGTIWAAGGTYKPVETDSHFGKADDYIIYDQGPDAWTWSVHDADDLGMFCRDRPPRSR